MANNEHLSVIKRGVRVWNKWRGDTFRGKPDLTRAGLSLANLSGADLSEADLSWADLSEADLSRANLSEANLSWANLSGAYLSLANLRWASLNSANLSEANLCGVHLNLANLSDVDLSGATLSLANLCGANLSGANLTEVDLSGALISGADLSGALIGWTHFGNNDLSEVRGLETVMHRSPSTIGVDTFYKSDGKIPQLFLRGAGIPEDFITFVPSLVGRAIEFYSCFISYSHQDEAFSRHLHARMRSENLRVWFAPEDMKGGKKLHQQIFSAIQIHDRLLLVLSEQSMNSEWVMTEVRRARKVEREQNRRKLFPIRLVDFEAIQDWECSDVDSGKDLAAELREYYIPDFSNWKDHDAFEREFAKLLRDLKATD